MKFYRLLLTTTPVTSVGPNVVFSYASVTREILTAPSQGSQGLSNDELVQAVAVSVKIKEAVATEKKEVLLSSEEHTFLVNRLNAFRWAFQSPDIAPLALEYVNHVRGLKEEEFEVAAKDKKK